jgi:hypothetical protein
MQRESLVVAAAATVQEGPDLLGEEKERWMKRIE